jgi:lipoprotein-anchoring transpeptidase ErfK/SrfK
LSSDSVIVFFSGHILGSLTMNKFFKTVLALAVVASFAIVPAEAAKRKKKYRTARLPPAVHVHVDISSQAMNVKVNGSSYGYWRVSTGRQGFATPRGSFSVKRMARMHYSRKYDNAPMPHSLFFHGGFAIHATNAVGRLGRPASHGCVRLAPGNAARLYALVQQYGPRRTRITLTN